MKCITTTVLLAIVLFLGGCANSFQNTSNKSNVDIGMLEYMASQGEIEAQVNLGLIYFEGKEVPQDYKKAKEYWELAANQGNSVAQNNLGIIYYDGFGVAQDYKKAKEYYELAVSQGYAVAQHNLGHMYEQGTGVPQDYKKAKV